MANTTTGTDVARTTQGAKVVATFSQEQLTAFDLEAFVTHANAFNPHTREPYHHAIPQGPEPVDEAGQQELRRQVQNDVKRLQRTCPFPAVVDKVRQATAKKGNPRYTLGRELATLTSLCRFYLLTLL